MRSALVLALLCALGGCSTFHERAFVELGLGVKVAEYTSAVLLPSPCVTVDLPDPVSCGGRNPTVHVRAGLELEHGLSVQYQHWSHLRDGAPFNERHEAHADEVLLAKRWGARRR